MDIDYQYAALFLYGIGFLTLFWFVWGDLRYIRHGPRIRSMSLAILCATFWPFLCMIYLAAQMVMGDDGVY